MALARPHGAGPTRRPLGLRPPSYTPRTQPQRCSVLARSVQRGRVGKTSSAAWPYTWRAADSDAGVVGGSSGTSFVPAAAGPLPTLDAATAAASTVPPTAAASGTCATNGKGRPEQTKGAGGAVNGQAVQPPHAQRQGEHVQSVALPARPSARSPSEPSTDTILTFAYGANMNFLTLARREVRVLSRDPAMVADPAVRLVFKHQGGYATLERSDTPDAGSNGKGQAAEPLYRPYDGRVHGVLYRVTRDDFAKLSKREGGYMVQEVQVQTYDGHVHTALAFVSNPLFKLPQEVAPTEAYLSKVREGAADNYLEPGYQAFLSGIATVPSAGLPSEYWNTPSKYLGYSFLLVVGLITVAFFVQH